MAYLILITFMAALVLILYPYIMDSIKDSVEETRELRREAMLERAEEVEAAGRKRLNRMEKEYSWLLFKARERQELQAGKRPGFLKVIDRAESRPVPNL